MDEFWAINSRQIYYHLHYLLLLVSYIFRLDIIIFSYILGLKIHEFIELVLPLYVRLRTGSENTVWGKIVLDTLEADFIFDMI